MDDQLAQILTEVTPRIGAWYPDRLAAADARVVVECDDRRSVNRVIRLRVTRDDAAIATLIVEAENSTFAPTILADDRPRLMPVTAVGPRHALEQVVVPSGPPGTGSGRRPAGPPDRSLPRIALTPPGPIARRRRLPPPSAWP